MPRYVIETDKPLEKCWDCPFVLLANVNKLSGELVCRAMCCTIKDKRIGVKTPGEHIPYDVGTRSRPSWCPLQLLDDASLE